MLEFVRQWYIKNKNPCKKCLVQAACQKTCTTKENFYKTARKINKLDSEIEIGFLLTCFLSGILFMVITFIFGLWKWVELTPPIIKWIFGLFK